MKQEVKKPIDNKIIARQSKITKIDKIISSFNSSVSSCWNVVVVKTIVTIRFCGESSSFFVVELVGNRHCPILGLKDPSSGKQRLLAGPILSKLGKQYNSTISFSSTIEEVGRNVLFADKIMNPFLILGTEHGTFSPRWNNNNEIKTWKKVCQCIEKLQCTKDQHLTRG